MTGLHLFHSDVSDFIYQANTGIFYDLAEQLFRNNCVRLAECLPVYEYSQSPAELQGLEWQWALPSWPLATGQLNAELFADYVRGRLTGATTQRAIPRMPSWRMGISVEWSNNAWLLEASSTYVAEQNDPGEFETTTDSYVRVDGAVHLALPVKGGQGSIFLKGKNLTDTGIRNATSFIRNFTPEPGRSVELGIRWEWP